MLRSLKKNKTELELNLAEHVSFKIQVNTILVHMMIDFPDSYIKKTKIDFC